MTIHRDGIGSSNLRVSCSFHHPYLLESIFLESCVSYTRSRHRKLSEFFRACSSVYVFLPRTGRDTRERLDRVIKGNRCFDRSGGKSKLSPTESPGGFRGRPSNNVARIRRGKYGDSGGRFAHARRFSSGLPGISIFRWRSRARCNNDLRQSYVIERAGTNNSAGLSPYES